MFTLVTTVVTLVTPKYKYLSGGTCTHQVIDAQEKGLDAPVALTIPAGRDAQVNPHQLRKELHGEAAQAILRTPVQLKQLMADRLQELDWKGRYKINTNTSKA